MPVLHSGSPRLTVLLLASWLVAVSGGGGCASSRETGFQAGEGGGGDDASSTSSGSTGGGMFGGSEGGSVGEAGQGPFDVEPSAIQSVTVGLGQTAASMPYVATLDGSPVNVSWTVDQGELGTIGAGPSSTATFTANGTAGGLLNVIAGYQGRTVKRQVLVVLDAGMQNGPNGSAVEQAQVATAASQLAVGGGIGGVGGEGLGPAVTDMPTLMSLQHPADNGQSQNLQVLYPYDKTVFPRGLLAPLVQWSWTPGDADAVQISLATTSGSFSWTGTFARPAVLASTGTNFIRNPIPQDVWAAATSTAGGTTANGKVDQLMMSLVVAKGGVAHGPVTETWTIAPARLEGTLYYNSYGTRLIQNSNFLTKDGVLTGAAVLGIKAGALAPVVVAGDPATSSTDMSGDGCRGCHTVSSGGSTIVAVHGNGNYGPTSWYGLQSPDPNATETLLQDVNLFQWVGLSADGKLALTNSADLAAGTPDMQLYAFPAPSEGNPGAQPLASNIPAGVKGGTPAFSPDTKHVAFELIDGALLGATASANQPQLIGLDFDSSTLQFSNLKVLATMPSGYRAGFPSFFPTNDAVAFHYQIVSSNHRYNTWHGTQAQIWWSDLATGTATNFNLLNGLRADGTSYLPTGPSNHGNDTTLNYEPTVNPVSSGGYIWVVFTSRRLYGNVATTDPWQSDPVDYDDSVLANATTKKLWVAAIDLGAAPGTDPSHPAFYLPAQELLAGNSRGFWVLDPCKADGMSCMSGDECCDGYCEPSAGGALVCTNTPPNNSCSKLQEKCATAADCCNLGSLCINGFCAEPAN